MSYLPNTAVLAKVFTAVEMTTHTDDVSLTASTRISADLGLGEFGRFRLTMNLEDTFDIEFTNEEVRRFVTLGDIATLLAGRYIGEVEGVVYRLAA